MKENLFRPSLGNVDALPVKSYDVGRLFLVAFFGGFLSMAAIGTMNGNWLKLDKKILILLGALGILLLGAKVGLLYLMASGQVELDNRMYRRISQIGYVLYFAAYYLAMRRPFRLFVTTGGQPLPLLKPAILWILVGGAIETALALGIAWSMNYDLL